jgi:hypothetical protein
MGQAFKVDAASRRVINFFNWDSSRRDAVSTEARHMEFLPALDAARRRDAGDVGVHRRRASLPQMPRAAAGLQADPVPRKPHAREAS